MFQFSAYPLPRLCIQRGVPINWGITPFGNLRIKVFWQLPAAYRSLIRPSSVLLTKASTVRLIVEYYLTILELSVFSFQLSAKLLTTDD